MLLGPTVALRRGALRRHRLTRGWTQQALGSATRLSQTAVSRIETARFPRVARATADRLARALGIEPIQIIGPQ